MLYQICATESKPDAIVNYRYNHRPKFSNGRSIVGRLSASGAHATARFMTRRNGT
jgi:hypothetical protein